MDIDKYTRDHCRTKSDEAAYDAGMRLHYGAANRVRVFFSAYLKHHTGKWAGMPFELLAWQWEDVVLPAFGWLKGSGKRRFKKIYVFVPKKNGKSTLTSGIGLYLTCADGESSAEIYSLASDRQQASIIYNEAYKMVQASEELSSIFYPVVSKKELHFKENHSWMKALSSDAKRKEGYNIHGCLCDEIHAWPKDNKLWDAVKYAGASREQPMFMLITTAGDTKEGLWYDEYCYSKKVLSGTTVDTNYLPVLYEALEPQSNDEGVEIAGDELSDPETWKKANPSLGETISIETFQEEFKEAQDTPQKYQQFLRYRLNLVRDNYSKWIDQEAWDRCKTTVSIDDLRGKKCYAGWDLSSKVDLAGFVLFFPKPRAFLTFPFLPIDRLAARRRERRFLLDGFVRKGHIRTVPGVRQDYEVMLKSFREEIRKYRIAGIGFDPWNATHMMNLLMGEGHKEIVYECRQGAATMSEPMKWFEAEVLAGKIQHFDNPVLRWCVNNTVAESDANYNIRPTKKMSPEKIDMCVAALIAVALHIQDEIKPKSVYEKEDLCVL